MQPSVTLSNSIQDTSYRLSKLRASELIAISLLLTFSLGCFNADLFVIFFESSQILASLGELALLHALADIPVNESPLAVHEIELVVDAGEHFRDSCAVTDHTTSPHHLRKITTRNNCWRLVIDTTLESCGAPVHELDGPLGLDGSNCCINILRYDITPVHHAA